MDAYSSRSSPWIMVAGLFTFSVLLWLPALTTPLWGDDYGFLQAAKNTRLQDQSWWQAFWPEHRAQFWRPLSMDTYFRILETFFNGNSRAAHLANWTIWLTACLAVGLFAKQLSRAMGWLQPWLVAGMSTVIFSLNGVHFLPVHWVSAANSSWLVLWHSLAMALWLSTPHFGRTLRYASCLILPLLQLLALWSKESSILLPLLLLLIAGLCFRKIKPGWPEICAWFMCVGVCAIWWVLYRTFTQPIEHAYTLDTGIHVFKNLALLFAWMVNVPREALRLLANGAFLYGLAWALAALIPMSLALSLLIRNIRDQLNSWQLIIVIVFPVLAYAPYLLLPTQSYAYYAAVSIMLPTVFLAQALTNAKRSIVAASLLCLSSFVAVHGSRIADYPGVIGRARWAEEQLLSLESQTLIKPLLVQVRNYHQFYAIGRAGLAWRLGFEQGDIILVDSCPEYATTMLAQAQNGNFYWHICDVDN